MKKIFLSFSLFLLFSCSNDNSELEEQNVLDLSLSTEEPISSSLDSLDTLILSSSSIEEQKSSSYDSLEEQVLSSSSLDSLEEQVLSSSSIEEQMSSSLDSLEVQISSSSIKEQIFSSSSILEPVLSSSSISYPKVEGIYLGSGYDVINSSYINRNDVKLTNPVLNVGKMYYEGIIVEDKNATEQKFEYFAGTSESEFHQDRNKSITASLSFGAVLFSGKFSMEFKSSKSSDASSSFSYARGRSYRYVQEDYILGATPYNLKNYITESFLYDLERMSASQIFERYGTHVLIRYYKGGSLEFNYTYKVSELKTSLKTSSELKLAVKASFASLETSLSEEQNESRRELENNSEFYYYTRGGAALGSTELAEMKKDYGSWTSSINSYADICGIGDFEQSFIPLWELVEATGNSAKAMELANEFSERVKAINLAAAKEAAKEVAKAAAKAAAKEAAKKATAATAKAVGK